MQVAQVQVVVPFITPVNRLETFELSTDLRLTLSTPDGQIVTASSQRGGGEDGLVIFFDSGRYLWRHVCIPSDFPFLLSASLSPGLDFQIDPSALESDRHWLKVGEESSEPS